MRKFINKLSDGLGTMLLLFVIVGVFTTQSKPKRFKWRYVLVTLLLGFLGWQVLSTYPKEEYNDCVPTTLQRVFPQYSSQELRRICQTFPDGTAVSNIFSAWEVLSTNTLEVHYSAATDYPALTNSVVRFDTPYLWIGIYKSNGHCALVQFTPTNVVFSHSQFYPGTTNYYVTGMNYYEFFDNTLLVLQAKEINDSIRIY